jgi:broad specificity phosphatase PhoE
MPKNIFYFLLFMFCANNLTAQLTFKKGTKIYIVRHAEKDTGNNPNLTNIGQKRAEVLGQVLANKKITAAFSTNTKRTVQTATIALANSALNIVTYNNDSNYTQLKTLIKNANKKNVLVVGHSNTVCTIIKAFGVKKFTRTQLDDFEYDKLFILKYKRKKVQLITKQFGTLYLPK